MDLEAFEIALERNTTRLLLELGAGFAFMGTQKEIVAFGKPRGRRDGRRRKTDLVSFARHLLFACCL
ncbi:MAG: DUF1016 family protein [Atopobiaceae bacterium]|nr:DUF1016 family protein [Atopobiaceae bacterium]